jgi:preprotein translocase subunit SecG
MIWTILVTIHVVVCLLLVLAVLIQQGKGASMGILSGASQSWFGPTGSKTLLMKVTVGLASAFLLLSLLITMAGSRRRAMVSPTPVAPEAQGAPAGK